MTSATRLAELWFLVAVTLPVFGAGQDNPSGKGKADSAPAAAVDPLAEARALTNKEDWENAASKYRSFCEAHPGDSQAPEARFWAGFCLVKLGENEKAATMLQPFLKELAEDKWADDALLQLGKAYHGEGKEKDALGVWKRHLEKYPDSVWRTDVSLDIIDVLFHGTRDMEACYAACDRLMKEGGDRGSTTEARYAGAFCLNALRRFDESEAWADRHLDPESSLEEAWRRLLRAQRDLLQGRTVDALAEVDALAVAFPDLDRGSRQDLTLRTSYILRSNGQGDRAREMILDELRLAPGRPEDEVTALLDELESIFGEDHRVDFLAALNRLTTGTRTSIVARVVARERLVQSLRDDDHSDRAETLLREAMTTETTEFGRFRVAIQLASVLAEDLKQRDAAANVLKSLLPRLKRRDLIHQLQEALNRRQTDAEPKAN
ncbi:MAG: hypothetical protein NVSMB9_16840 [Isosphaeraceae bacterium]